MLARSVHARAPAAKPLCPSRRSDVSLSTDRTPGRQCAEVYDGAGKQASSECRKGGILSHTLPSAMDRRTPKADGGRSTPHRHPLGEIHPEPRARVHPVRLELSSRQADNPLLRLQFAIIIAPVNLRPCRGQSYVPVIRAAASGPDLDGLYLARDLTS